MIATAHALIGGAIAASIPNPAVGLPLAVLSHPLIDSIPHWDFAQNWRQKKKLILFLQTALDTTFGITLAYFIFGQNINFWYFMAIVIASVACDIFESPYWFFNWHFPPFSWIYELQHRLQWKTNLAWGILTQVITVIGTVLLLNILT